jgi:hypothetical protein
MPVTRNQKRRTKYSTIPAGVSLRQRFQSLPVRDDINTPPTSHLVSLTHPRNTWSYQKRGDPQSMAFPKPATASRHGVLVSPSKTPTIPLHALLGGSTVQPHSHSEPQAQAYTH